MGKNATVDTSQAVIEEFAEGLTRIGGVSDLWLIGSAARDDYHPGVSDVNLIALVDGPLTARRRRALERLHRRIDHGSGRGLRLGCCYVDYTRMLHTQIVHPAWADGSWTQRPLSPLDRVELAQFGMAVRGRDPRLFFPGVGEELVRAAVRDELRQTWRPALGRRRRWLKTEFADRSLITMARARRALATGELVGKDAVLDELAVPENLREQVRQRRLGMKVSSPTFKLARLARRDARQTVQDALN